MQLRTVRDVSVAQRRVLVRVDFNVPLTEEGEVADDSRIRAAGETIEYLRARGARVVLMSHLGRPGGRFVRRFSLRPVAGRLSEILDCPVTFVPEVVGREAQKRISGTGPGEVLLLENLRFNPGEKKNDPQFAGRLASMVDIYVNDAFGVAHRTHASTHGITEYLPAVAGLLMEREVNGLGRLLRRPASPYVAVMGGAKISTKVAACRRFLQKVDALLLGGGLANTFLACMGYDIGNSLVEPDMLDEAEAIIAGAKRRGVRIMLPLDVVVTRSITSSENRQVVDVSSIPKNWSVADIGPRSVERYQEQLAGARTVFWNGPMGVFEVEGFARGTRAIARTLSEMKDARTVVGGGESVEAVRSLGLTSCINHVSTGGGAALAFLAEAKMPPLEVLKRKGKRMPWVGGNWKMNFTRGEARSLACDLAEKWSSVTPEVVLFPPHPYLADAVEQTEESPIMVGGQDCHWEMEGSYTAGVSPRMLKSTGCVYALVGHSECRRYLGDDDERVAAKLSSALDNGLRTVLCVGESQEDREEERHLARISEQLGKALSDLGERFATPGAWHDNLLVAYEPVWAIGAGQPATPEDVARVVEHIRDQLENLLGSEESRMVRILYGGSVNAENVGDFLGVPGVDGVLVGGASQSTGDFLPLLVQVRDRETDSGGEE